MGWELLGHLSLPITGSSGRDSCPRDSFPSHCSTKRVRKVRCGELGHPWPTGSSERYPSRRAPVVSVYTPDAHAWPGSGFQARRLPLRAPRPRPPRAHPRCLRLRRQGEGRYRIHDSRRQHHCGDLALLLSPLCDYDIDAGQLRRAGPLNSFQHLVSIYWLNGPIIFMILMHLLKVTLRLEQLALVC